MSILMGNPALQWPRFPAICYWLIVPVVEILLHLWLCKQVKDKSSVKKSIPLYPYLSIFAQLINYIVNTQTLQYWGSALLPAIPIFIEEEKKERGIRKSIWGRVKKREPGFTLTEKESLESTSKQFYLPIPYDKSTSFDMLKTFSK